MTALRTQEVSGATDDVPVVRERGDIMASDGRVRVGLVGLGRMGSFHAANLAGRVPGTRLARIADAAEGVARETSGRLGGVRWSTGYEDLLEDPEVEAVVVAIPTLLHAEMAEAAAAAGKHIFCEKPVSLEIEPTYRLIEAVRTAGVKMQVGFQRRFDPYHLRARIPHPGRDRRRRAQRGEPAVDRARNLRVEGRIGRQNSVSPDSRTSRAYAEGMGRGMRSSGFGSDERGGLGGKP